MSHCGRLWGLHSSGSSWYHSPGALCTRFRCFLIRLSAHTAWHCSDSMLLVSVLMCHITNPEGAISSGL